MSWYVRRLLLDRDSIRSSIVTNYGVLDNCTYDVSTDDLDWIDNFAYQIYSFDSDVYNDLMIVETKIKELTDCGMISKDELNILDQIMSGKSIAQVVRSEGVVRLTISRKFNDVCSRIAFHLGGIFTDDGYLYYMANKYNLHKEQISKLKNIMSEEK